MMNTSIYFAIHIDAIESQTAYIFTGLFFVFAVTSSIGNTLALIIMYQTKNTNSSTRMVSTWFLCSLALAGVINGLSSLFCGIHLFTIELRKNHILEYIRRYMGIWISGVLVVSLACISYDRYILLKYKTNHNKYMTRGKAIVLMIFGWTFPLVVPLIRHVNDKAFYLIISLTVVISFVCISVGYGCILKLVFKSEAKMVQRHSFKFSCNRNTIVSNITSTLQTYNVEKPKRLQTIRTIRLARTVCLLLLSFLVCHSLITLYVLARITKRNFTTEKNRQIFLLVTEVTAQSGATFNVVIYFMKSSMYRKAARNMWANRNNKHNK